MRRSTAVVLCMIAAGCAAGRVGPLPQVDARNAATIHVIRGASPFGYAWAFRFTLDGDEIFDIRSGQHATLQVAPGMHRVEVKCFGGIAPVVQTHGDDYDIVRDRPNYFIVSPNLGLCALIRAGTPEEAQALLKDSTRLAL